VSAAAVTVVSTTRKAIVERAGVIVATEIGVTQIARRTAAATTLTAIAAATRVARPMRTVAAM
jgi:hypothetical protein